MAQTIDLDHLTPGRRLRVLRVVAGLKLWELATRAGYKTRFVRESEISVATFKDVAVWFQPGGEATEMPVPCDEAVPVADLQHVAVAAPPAGAHDGPVTDSADRRSRGGGVVGPFVLLPHAENGMVAAAERG